ncbi:zinc finger BED domain-containing protein 4-like isoform X2 [Polypterus senegalus]|uniref:zinc finger BED domain-containing protein 4-like isoform X2 n=1 Tax=Polypterus senegalus TaxID=55291 RepID=UPI0019632B47|nr:zinc finger BED domain-containing protein 4-like isoform X2 [Polypterus senegalus]
MLSMTAQWLDEEYNMHRATLHAQELPGSHTAQTINNTFEKIFQHWNIGKETVHVVLRDNARNMIKAMELCGVASLGCMAHTLQLAVNEAVLSQRTVSDCIAIGRKIVGHFKHSQVATSTPAQLNMRLGITPAHLQQDVSTRWNSTFYMLRSLLQQKQALAVYGVDNKLPATLSPLQWTLIENMLTILDPCEQLTRDISRATATAADVIPAVQALKRFLTKNVPTDHGVKTSKSTLLEAVNKRFDHIEAEPLYVLATILDPRYKDQYFTTSKQQAREMLQEWLESSLDPCDSLYSPDEPQAQTTKADGKSSTSLLDMYAEILKENDDGTQHAGLSDTVVVEMQTYPSESTLPMSPENPPENYEKTMTPLEYWNSNKYRFPHLAELARKYLSAPCTSIDSERLFSAAANVLDEKRNRLSCDKAEMLLFVKKNLPLIRPQLTKKK